MSTSSSSKLQTSDGKLAAGLQQSQANLPALMILGKTYTAAVAVTVLQQRIALRSASTSARAAWQAAMQAEAEETANTKAFVAALVQQIRVWFANAPDALATYGLVPKKSVTKSPVTKVLATAKGLQTRKLRHTMGKVQKEGIKGSIPATISIQAPAGSTQVETAPVVAAGPAVSASNGISPQLSKGPAAGASNGASTQAAAANGSAPHTPNGTP